MSTGKWMALAVALGVATVALLAWHARQQPDAHKADGRSPGSPWITAQVPRTTRGSDAAPEGTALNTDATRHDGGMTSSPLDNVAPPEFHADDKGALVLNGDTRDGIDMLASLYDRERAMAKLAEATQALPATAQRQARDLYEHYVQYTQALRQRYPAEQQASMTLPEAQEAFESLQQLRQAYLGDQAQALFGREEAVTRTLFAYSGDYLKTHPNASLEEAAQVAQERYAREQETGPASP